jgi:transposase-like protein
MNLQSYGAAKRELLPGVEHRQHRSLNNRAENSPQSAQQRERRMQGFIHPQARRNGSGLSASTSVRAGIGSAALAYRQKLQNRFHI